MGVGLVGWLGWLGWLEVRLWKGGVWVVVVLVLVLLGMKAKG